MFKKTQTSKWHFFLITKINFLSMIVCPAELKHNHLYFGGNGQDLAM